MGALHEGHLTLVQLAKARCRRAVVSIFVNPAQFAPSEDFERYPRDEAGDLAKLASVGCDAVWSPDRALMYPDGFATRIVPAGAAVGSGKRVRGRTSSAAWRRSAASCSRRSDPTPPCSARRTTSSSASSGRWCATSTCPSKSSARRRCAQPTASPSPRAMPTSPPSSAASRLSSTKRSPELQRPSATAATRAGHGERALGSASRPASLRSTTSRCATPRRSRPPTPARSAPCACSPPPGSARPA